MENENQVIEEKIVPAKNSLEWSDYVMSLFVPEELVDGAPNIDGLRRLTELLIGEIIEVSTPIVVVAPSSENHGYATVSLSLVVHGYNGQYYKMGDAADVNPSNTDAPYNKHPVATAVTRAEARIYRKLLRLRKIISAEEKSLVADGKTEESFDEDKINVNQLTMLDVLGQRYDINLTAYLNSGSKTYASIYDISFATAAKMASKINEIAKEGIPPSLKGYKKEWKK